MSKIYHAKSLLTLMFVLALPLAPAIGDEDGVYSAYDSNADGFLNREEYERFLKKRRVKAPYQHLWVFADVDADDDGKISNQELVNTLQKEISLRQQQRK